ncbi:hypothetical protein GCM10027598_23210 [Amycolatopsis oliviviridis]|uniref:Uncharacterized protein n=1 Tax=Amycolatopsis oliviviridis TaxID=1471590 RepID=A0ABQ3LH29_9PSEU|nr:hypothetical protein GCM10017790_30850 [Amycolatopsis oliviviridis]
MLCPGQMLTGETIAVPRRVLITGVDHVATAADFELDDAIETAIPLPDDLRAQFRGDAFQFLRIRIMKSPREPVQAPADGAAGRSAQGFQG